MAGDELGTWLQRFGDTHGFAAGETCEPVRPPEVISGASGVQTSTGEVTYETMEEEQDFGFGTRENAATNDHDDYGSHYSEGANPMQSPNLGQGTFAKRFGIGFLCANYPGKEGDLPDIALLSKPKSEYLAAFRGMDKTRQYKDPTASTMRSKVAWWTKHLSKQLGDCEQGELVISFQGHGQNGTIYGCDNKTITSGAMLSMSKKALERRVSLTWVLDACFSGNAVAPFQDNAADTLDQRINETEGAGAVCSEENYEAAERFRAQMPHVRKLIQLNESVGKLTYALQRTVDDLEKVNSEEAWENALTINGKIIEYLERIQDQFQHNIDTDGYRGLGLEKVDAKFDEVLSFLAGIEPYTSWDYDQWTSRIGRLQDFVSDAANKIMKRIDQELAARR